MARLRVLIGCLFFRDFTGSELYVYELARCLRRMDCDVSVIALKKGGPVTSMAEEHGIAVYAFADPPMGSFDVIHGQHGPAVERLVRLFPRTPKICTIHSELLPVEDPVRHPTIHKYIAIRPAIKQRLVSHFGIPESLVDVIYNPIDETRFNTDDTRMENALLFVGTLDPLRKATVLDLVDHTRNHQRALWLVGRDRSDYLAPVLAHPHVTHHKPTYHIETLTKRCAETAGILLGRTTIEGWMCGKSGWIYTVDAEGRILDKRRHDPPPDTRPFHAQHVAGRIRDEYARLVTA